MEKKKGYVCFQGAIMLTGEYMVCLVVGYKNDNTERKN